MLPSHDLVIDVLENNGELRIAVKTDDTLNEMTPTEFGELCSANSERHFLFVDIVDFSTRMHAWSAQLPQHWDCARLLYQVAHHRGVRFGNQDELDQAFNHPRDSAGMQLIAGMISSLQDGHFGPHCLNYVYQAIEKPLVPVTAEMSANGLLVDRDTLTQSLDEAQANLRDLTGQIRQVFPGVRNPRDHVQLRELLYTQLNFPVTRLNKRGGPSTSKDTFRFYARNDPRLGTISTFIATQADCNALSQLASAINSDDQVHATLNQMGCATGRFTCIDPGLMSIPKKYRNLIVARPGNQLVEIDQTTAEIHVAAALSQDQILINDLQAHEYHRRMASILFQRPEDSISAEDRNIAKTISFLIIYGGGGNSIAEKTRIDRYHGDHLVEMFWARYPTLREFRDQHIGEALQSRLTQTYYGRQRHFDEYVNDAKIRTSTLNSIIQGTAADLMKMILVRLRYELPNECKFLLCLHDSVLLEVPIDVTADIAHRAAQVASSGDFNFPIAIPVKAKYGPNWGDMTPIGEHNQTTILTTALTR